MMQSAYCMMSSPVGMLRICEDGSGICELSFCRSGEVQKPHTPLLYCAQQELEAYFAGELRTFSVPVSMHGTAFQKQVWQALRTIPFGETRTYGQIAAQIGSPAACRAVGMANRCNPIAIIIPCHRVIGSNGSLTGYAGGLDIKRALLSLEGILCR